MTKNNFSYQLFNWGPMLCKIKINAADLKKYTELCSKKTSSANKNLAGLIKHQHEINLHEYGKLINPYIHIFYESFKQWCGVPPPAKIAIMKAWVNFMVAGEFNPPHIHTNCDFSSVLFIQVPKELKEERKKFIGTGGGPGALSFMHGGAQNFSINHINLFPEEGDFFIFPSTLTHFVSPFTSKGERISIGANFKFALKRK